MSPRAGADDSIRLAVSDEGEDRPPPDASDDEQPAARRSWTRLGALTRSAWVVAVCSIYPALFMRGLLWPASPYHLRSPWAEPDRLTDLDAGIRLAQVIDATPWPWSDTTLTAVPSGESLLRWQSATQGIQIAALFLFTRVAPPAFSVNLLLFLGWVTTGVAAFVLARRLGASTTAAVIAAVAAQMLPSIPTMASNFTSYVFLGVPIAVVITTLDFGSSPSFGRLGRLLAACAVALFFDPYWFFFSIVIVVVGLACHGRAVWAWIRTMTPGGRAAMAALAASPFVLVGAVLVLDRLVGASAVSRPLGVADRQLVVAGLRSPTDWFRSSFEGLGIVAGLVGLACVLVALTRRTTDRGVFTVALTSVILALLATRTSFETPLFGLGSASEAARFVLPGVRFFQRAALIAEVLVVVIAVVTIEPLLRSRLRPAVAASVAVVLVVGMALEFSLPSPRDVQRRWDDFAEFRRVVAEVEDPVVAALPFDRVGRDWFELSLLGPIPTANPLYASAPRASIARAASRGPGDLAAHLGDLGVTHLLAVVDPGPSPLRYELAAPRFESRASIVLDAYGAPEQRVVMFEVHPQPGDVHCAACPAGSLYDWDLKLRAEGAATTLERSADGASSWWWVTGRRAQLIVEQIEPGIEDGATLAVSIGNAPCGDPRQVSVVAADFETASELVGSELLVVEVPMSAVRSAGGLTIEAVGAVCRIPGDPRDLMVQVISPTVVTVAG